MRTVVHRVTSAAQVTQVRCDRCGRTNEGDAMSLQRDMHHIQVVGGYGDEFPLDGTSIVFDVCSTCLLAWTAGFSNPVKQVFVGTSPETAYEQDVHTAVHTEDGIRMDVSLWNDVAWPEGTWSDDVDFPDDDLDFPAPGVYLHHKGRYYEVLRGVHDGRPPHEPLVLYRALYEGSLVFVRPLRMWAEEVAPGVTRFTRTS